MCLIHLLPLERSAFLPLLICKVPLESVVVSAFGRVMYFEGLKRRKLAIFTQIFTVFLFNVGNKGVASVSSVSLSNGFVTIKI